MIKRQTYEEYLVTMKAYRFHPMDQELWQEWQDYYVAKEAAIGGYDHVRS